jgi:hypothetical protein
MNNSKAHQKMVKPIVTLLLFLIAGGLILSIGLTDSKANSTSSSDKQTLTINVFIPLLFKDFPEKNIFGAQLDTIISASGLDQMVKANSTWTRKDFDWQLVEPTEGERNWAAVKYYEDELVTASQNGIHVIMILLDTPSWARVSPACGGKVLPGKLPALASFVHDLVDRYSRPPFNIKYFEMWNEPDVDGLLGCWGDINDHSYYGGKGYGEMLKLVYPAAKAANPSSQIVVGGLLLDCDPGLGIKDCTPAYFLKGILESGAMSSFDGVAFHSGDYYSGALGRYSNSNFGAAWNTTGPVTAVKASFLKNLLSQYNAAGKYLINTEAGIKCISAKCAEPSFGFEETKAYYMVQDGATALSEHYKANIWYSVYGDGYSGLLTKNNEPFPAYYAFQFMNKKLENHTFFQRITSYPGVKGFEFWSPTGRKLWVLWSLDGNSHPITLPGSPVSLDVISPSGNAVGIPLSPSLTIGIAPVFIQY